MSEGAGEHRRTLAAMALGAIAISFAAIFLRLATGVSPLVAATIRLALAALLLSPAVVVGVRRGTLGPKVWRAGLLAGFFYAIHFGAWVSSLSLTTVAASVTLVTATPLLSALLALARGQDRPTARHGVGIALALVGTLVIAGDDLAGGRALGDLLSIVGAIAMVGVLAVGRSLGEERADPIAFSALAAGSGALFLLPALLVATLLGHAATWPAPTALGWIALSALVPQVVGHTLLTYALRRATPTEVGLATAAEPVLSTALGVFWLAETPSSLVLVGCAITLVGVTVGARPAR